MCVCVCVCVCVRKRLLTDEIIVNAFQLCQANFRICFTKQFRCMSGD